MNIVNSSVEFITPINREVILQRIEQIGRSCYKSEDKITNESAPKFVKMLVDRGHEAMIEHISLTIKFVTNRGVSHEMVRHRLANYAQESSRYCNYSKGKHGSELTFIDIKEGFPTISDEDYSTWLESMKLSETAYMEMINNGCKPDLARDVLPNSLKTEINMTANLREWRHFIRMRASKFAHPEIRLLAKKVYEEFVKELPEIFSDLKEVVDNA